MARLAARLDENAPGAFFVDDSCIDCGACREIAPRTFGRSPRRGQSFVTAQPSAPADELRALMALSPVRRRASAPHRSVILSAAVAAFPEQLEDDVFYCGWHSEASYGAASYLIVRPRGNVLVDSPRASRRSSNGLRRSAGCGRWSSAPGRRRGSRRVRAPLRLRARHARRRRRLASHRATCRRLQAVGARRRAHPHPRARSHPRLGRAPLSREVLFRDHLWWDEDDHRLDMGRGVCWYSWPEQLRSLDRLCDFRFQWVLPGHGQRFRARSTAAVRAALDEVVRRLSSTAR